jgi:hypothetical protein
MMVIKNLGRHISSTQGRAADHSCAHVVSSLAAGRGTVLGLRRRRVRHAREEDEEVARGGRHGCRRRGSTRERREEEGDFPLTH